MDEGPTQWRRNVFLNSPDSQGQVDGRLLHSPWCLYQTGLRRNKASFWRCRVVPAAGCLSTTHTNKLQKKKRRAGRQEEKLLTFTLIKCFGQGLEINTRKTDYCQWKQRTVHNNGSHWGTELRTGDSPAEVKHLSCQCACSDPEQNSSFSSWSHITSLLQKPKHTTSDIRAQHKTQQHWDETKQ